MKYLNETGLAYLWNNKLKPKFTELTNKTDQLSNPNLLINGDFQVNQRGQSRYEISNVWTYTFDMWRGHGWMSIEKTENGIKIQNNSDVKSPQWFNQKLEKSKNGTFTLSVKVISKSGKAIAKFESTNTLIGQIELSVGDNVLTVNAEDLLSITIEVGGSTTYGDYIELEYIDLFEGSVAWKHLKEDYATALMRCEDYVQKIEEIKLVEFSSGANSQSFFKLIKKMKSEPSFIKTSVRLYEISTAAETTINSYSILKESGYDNLYNCAINHSSASTKNLRTKITCIATCEPM